MAAKNYTIDDSQWETLSLHLSPGWNMLQRGGANEYLDQAQVDEMTPLLTKFWNESVSWTTVENASTTLTFIGTDIWLYGVSSPLVGAYSATLDNETAQQYTAIGDDVDYHRLLYAAHELEDGRAHNLTMTNTDPDGGFLILDYAIVRLAATSTSVANLSSSLSSPSPSLTESRLPSFLDSSSPSKPSVVPDSPSVPTTYSAAQLASLTSSYHFSWNSAAYFVVVFACLVATALIVLALRHVVSDRIHEADKETQRG